MTLDEIMCAADEFADAASAFDAGLATEDDDDSAVDAARVKLRAAVESYAATREREAVEREREEIATACEQHGATGARKHERGGVEIVRIADVVRARGREVKP
jgi:hypothetical protein